MNNPKTDSRSNPRKGRKTGRLAATSRPREIRHSANSEQPTTGNPSSTARTMPYPSYLPLDECLLRYNQGVTNGNRDGNNGCAKGMIIRGKLRVLPGLDKSSFVTCDRGYVEQDVIVPDMFHRNRALDGDIVYVELIDGLIPNSDFKSENSDLARFVEHIVILDSDKENVDDGDDEAGDIIAVGWHQGNDDTAREFIGPTTWQDDEMQMDIWNPKVTIIRRELEPHKASSVTIPSLPSNILQPCGRVVHVVYPKRVSSEIGQNDAISEKAARRRIVGSLMALQSGTILLTSTNKSLPQFKCVAQDETKALMQEIGRDHDVKQGLFQAEYEYGSWDETHNWPPCSNVKFLGASCVIENEIQALLTDNQVDHGDFSTSVLKDVDSVVQSGLLCTPGCAELEWKPTPDMHVGRRDYRKQRIFTIDPTTAKDLDDALHVTQLPNGLIEVGVHIADVSFFVRPDTAVDTEAIHRATTVYLVDRTVPMLPRPLCEVACSLNENVERLAFSCVWTMNADGTLRIKGNNDSLEDVWYGRTIIKSCARLDYATAQNIIDNKVAKPGDDDESVNEELWPISRRPTGDHTMQQVAADVRLMHQVAMARRRLRFENGALALNSTKLTFQLDDDGQTPILAAPYPIRDSNRLIEEYMLLANYLVAQRLITHAGELACLRHHHPPKIDSMDKVAAIAKASLNFDIDVTSSQSLHESLVRLGQICHDPLVLTCITQMMTLPMQQAKYFAAGTLDQAEWRHFALNMPYYTHFTSPIRRYPDIIVHRLLQATLDGAEAVRDMPQDVQDIEQLCVHCSEKQMASKNAQQRCDRVFLSLFIRKNPMKSQMGIVLSVGRTAFTVFLPSIGADAMLYLEEHKNVLAYSSEERGDNTRILVLENKLSGRTPRWKTLEITVFTKLLVTVVCNEKPPIDIKVKFEGPYL
jgi:DIS3-like exonuclease 2